MYEKMKISKVTTFNKIIRKNKRINVLQTNRYGKEKTHMNSVKSLKIIGTIQNYFLNMPNIVHATFLIFNSRKNTYELSKIPKNY